MIKITNLSIAYKDNKVINHSNLYANNGKVYVLNGDSGSGKSSIIQVLALIQKQKYEYFYIGDYNVNTLDETSYRKSGIGIVFQEKNIHSTMSVYENMLLFAYMIGKSLSKTEAKELLNFVLLDVPLNQNANTLSGGEKQRLAIACALLKDTPIILADEPTSGLDYENTIGIMKLFKKLALEYNKCIIIASHSDVVLKMADSIFYIENNKIICDEISVDEKITLTNNEVNPKFYLFYLFKSSLLKNKLYKFILLIISITLGIFISTNSIKQAIIEQSKLDISSLIHNDILIKQKEVVSNDDIEYFSQLTYVQDCDWYYEIYYENMILYKNPYNNLNLNNNEISISKALANNKSLEIGDSLYLEIEGSGKEFVVRDIIEKEYDDFSNINQYFVYLPNSVVEDIPTYSILLRIDDFMYIEKVIQAIHLLELDVNIYTKDGEHILFSSYQKETVQYIESIMFLMLLVTYLYTMYIQYLDIKSHRYNLALLKANGIKDNELIKLIWLRSGIVILVLFIISMVAYIGVSILYISKQLYANHSYMYDILYLMLIILVVVIIPSSIEILIINKISPNELMK